MEGNSLKSFENLCKIFEMRIKLDREKNIDTPEDVLINYEKYSKKIDSIYNSDFEKEIRPLITPSSTLEKEEERLVKLIKLLEDRLEKREELENKFYSTTGHYIKGLQLVVSEAELNEKKDRLDLITKYLNTKNEIDDITDGIAKLKNSLNIEENKCDEYIAKNKILEDELYASFTDIIKEDEYYRNVSESEIDTLLVSVLEKVKETKETLDVTKQSVDSLMFSGSIDDYSTYIEDAEKNYFVWKEKELILKIYEAVVKFEDNFVSILEKRETIDKLLLTRRKLRESLDISGSDKLLNFEKLLLNQINVLAGEKEILENISNYTSRIKFKEERLDELEKDNNSIEILAILREYGLIDTYDNEEIDVPVDELNEDEVLLDTVIEEFYDPYRIVEIKDYPKTLNLGLAKLKGESVREKVNKKLNPKKKEPTFDDITAVIDEKVENVVSEEVPVVSEDNNNEEIVDVVVPNIAVESEVTAVQNDAPVWNIPTNEVVSVAPSNVETQVNNNFVPVWEEIKPTVEVPKEEVKEIDNFVNTSNIQINAPSEVSTSSMNNNMFWTPVTDSNMDTNTFPEINIPIYGDNFDTNGSFGFPDIN